MKNIFSPKDKDQNKRIAERGNALFIIFIGIALFAALGFAVSNIMRTGNPGMIAEEKAGLLADTILDYAQNVRLSVQDIRISNGCSDTEISLTHETGDGYEHSPVAPDECRVFSYSGGGMSYLSPPPGANDGSDWYITGSRRIVDIGTDSALLMILPRVSRALCVQINNKVPLGAKNSEPPTELGYSMGFKFKGSYLAGGGIGDDTGGADLQGQSVGCFKSTSSPEADTYHFYKVLIAR